MKTKSILNNLAILSVALFVNSGHTANDDDHWLFSDFDERADEISEGALRILPSDPDAQYHHHQNIVTLLPDSHRDGWARLDQCHTNLDAVADVQITFNADRIRELRIVSSARIGRAWVEAASVQLSQVQAGASLCLSAETRVVWRHQDGSYSVRNGPYMRRFLDGYYPMQVSLELKYPVDQWRVASHQPVIIALQTTTTGVRLDVHFEGRLRTDVRLLKIDAH